MRFHSNWWKHQSEHEVPKWHEITYQEGSMRRFLAETFIPACVQIGQETPEFRRARAWHWPSR